MSMLSLTRTWFGYILSHNLRKLCIFRTHSNYVRCSKRSHLPWYQ